MRTIARDFIAGILALLAWTIVRKYKPVVIMVTGSVGKTSTKDAIAAALSERAYLRASEKSYNSEFGVPLTIFGVKNPWKNPISWIGVFKEALALVILPNHYPKLLVLEVGADRPGDLMKILAIVNPDAVVVTRLPEVPVHVEAYPSPEAVREEEFVPAYGLSPGSPLIVNAEDEYARRYAKRLPVSIHTFGFSDEADVYVARESIWMKDQKPRGMEAVVRIKGKSYPLQVEGAIGRPQLLGPAAALALSLTLGHSVDDALTGLSRYEPPPGRMRLLDGKGGSLIIDDSYNASPAAVEEALDALSHVPARRRIVVLGDMLELGRYSREEHERIGALIARHADVYVAVGIRSRAAASAARHAGMKDADVIECDNAAGSAQVLLSMLRPGDVVLVKGSQSVRTEYVVEALLADPEDSRKLVRQEKEWKERH